MEKIVTKKFTVYDGHDEDLGRQKAEHIMYYTKQGYQLVDEQKSRIVTASGSMFEKHGTECILTFALTTEKEAELAKEAKEKAERDARVKQRQDEDKAFADEVMQDFCGDYAVVINSTKENAQNTAINIQKMLDDNGICVYASKISDIAYGLAKNQIIGFALNLNEESANNLIAFIKKYGIDANLAKYDKTLQAVLTNRVETVLTDMWDELVIDQCRDTQLYYKRKSADKKIDFYGASNLLFLSLLGEIPKRTMKYREERLEVYTYDFAHEQNKKELDDYLANEKKYKELSKYNYSSKNSKRNTKIIKIACGLGVAFLIFAVVIIFIAL